MNNGPYPDVTVVPGRSRVAERTPLRRDAADILTSLGWLSGTLHIPSHLGLQEYLSLGTQELKLTGVRVPGESEQLRFLALRRDATLLVAPSVAEECQPSEYLRAREVACLLPSGILRGTLQVQANMRLSDHLSLEGPWVTLRRCLLAPYGETGRSPAARAIHTSIINLSQVIGISDAP
jgi:hypothetical protein